MPPMGFGHRRADVVNKLRAFTHQFLLLFGRDGLSHALKSLICLTTDFGTESNIAKARALPDELLIPVGFQAGIVGRGR